MKRALVIFIAILSTPIIVGYLIWSCGIEFGKHFEQKLTKSIPPV